MEKTAKLGAYGLYFSPNIIRVIKYRKNEMVGACGMYGGQET